ncbi:hypothetical protein SprV_0100129100 [Sparganum proliferum]
MRTLLTSVTIAIARSPHPSAWLTTCESITHAPANQCPEHPPAFPTSASTAITVPAHPFTAWAYSITYVSTRAEFIAVSTHLTHLTQPMCISPTHTPSPSAPNTTTTTAAAATTTTSETDSDTAIPANQCLENQPTFTTSASAASLNPNIQSPHGSTRTHGQSRRPAVDNPRLHHTITLSPTRTSQHHHPSQAPNFNLPRKSEVCFLILSLCGCMCDLSLRLSRCAKRRGMRLPTDAQLSPRSQPRCVCLCGVTDWWAESQAVTARLNWSVCMCVCFMGSASQSKTVWLPALKDDAQLTQGRVPPFWSKRSAGAYYARISKPWPLQHGMRWQFSDTWFPAGRRVRASAWYIDREHGCPAILLLTRCVVG